MTVSAAATNDFSISAAPGSLSLAQGTSGTSAVSTAVTSGAAQTVALTVGGVPVGATATLAPASVTAGSGSTLTVDAGTAAVGNYTLTVTGTATSATHSTTVALTVTSSAIVNGGFETGDASGWTASGPAVSVVSGVGRSGSYAAQAGSSSPTSGSSSLAQTFTATPGATTLSFWYLVSCAGTVRRDWATATLRDVTTGTTTTILPKTCTNGAGWKQVAAAVVAGHTYTIKLTNRDDNRVGSATSTLFDDVTLT